MSEIREYNYLKSYQRRLIYLNVFVSMAIAGFLFRNAVTLYGSVFVYQDVFSIAIVTGFLAHLAGFFSGKLLFSKIRLTRALYIPLEILFIGIAFFLSTAGLFFDCLPGVILRHLAYHPLQHIALMLLFPFLLGLKINYFLKSACGKFFDEKKGGTLFFAYFIGGLALGILLTPFFSHTGINASFSALLLLPALITAFIISLPYSPETILAKDHSAEASGEEEVLSQDTRDDLMFNYLNMSYIAVFTYLGALVANRYFGDTNAIRFTFLSVSVVSILAGYSFSRLIHRAFWHIYIEMTYPFLFMLFYLYIFLKSGTVPPQKALLAFVPCGIVFGLSLRQSVSGFMNRFDQIKSHQIAGFSFFLIPVPVVTAIALIPFTDRWFFVLFYLATALCLVLPGIHLAQRKVSEIRKIGFFVLSGISVPLFVAAHLHFKVPVSNEIFIHHVQGIENAANINSGVEYILDQREINIQNEAVMKVSDHSIRNLKRSVFATAVVAGDQRKTLFIDGYASFFQNPLFELFPDSLQLNYLPGRLVDYSRLPITGRKGIITENSDVLVFLSRNRTRYDMIVDMPNLYDLKKFYFRFSDISFTMIKKNLNRGGIYSVILPLSDQYALMRKVIFANVARNFAYRLFFVTEDYIMLMASDSSDRFAPSQELVDRYQTLCETYKQSQLLYFDDLHFLSAFAASNNFPAYSAGCRPDLSLSPEDPLSAEVRAAYYRNDSPLIVSPSNPRLASYLSSKFSREKDIISSLKDAERLEFSREFDREMEVLFSLKKFADYNYLFGSYLSANLALKEKAYVREAQNLENQKRWEEAQKVYRAILVINGKNFDANYRLGLVSLTLQDIDSAFKYLNTAISIDPTHSQVNYQIGILMMTRGEYDKALSYLQKSISLGNSDSMVVFYAGFCYENMNQLPNAETYYKQAFMRDPQNADIKSALERIAKKIEEERTKWQSLSRKSQREVEKDELFPLPINESAEKARLSDEDPDAAKKTR